MMLFCFLIFTFPLHFTRIYKNFIFTFRFIHNQLSSRDKLPALKKWALSFHELVTNHENESRRESARVSRKFFAAPALLFGNARGNLIALIIAPGAYLRRRLVTLTSSALVRLFALLETSFTAH